MRNGETRKGADYNRKSGTYTPPMPSSVLTFSSEGPTFSTAFLIFSDGVSSVRAQ